MTAQTPGAEDPIKYTKESLAGLRDVWLSFGKARFSQAAAAIEQFADKLPSKLPSALKKKPSSTSSTSSNTSSSSSDTTTAANAPS